MQDSLINYIIKGTPVGAFLNAVLEGNLFAAFRRADDVNIKKIDAYVSFLFNEAPAHQCYGNKETVNFWIKQGGLIGKNISVKDEER